ncbi:hypothetical protein JW823_01370 [bacterium]|nr:hypothetical protein [candidate division CSSED10-310 bacterium]
MNRDTDGDCDRAMVFLSIIKKNLDGKARLKAAEKRLTDAKNGEWLSDTDDWIREMLKHDNWQIRNVAVKLIGEGKKSEFTEVLTNFLTDGSQAGFVRRNSAISLYTFDSVEDTVIRAFFVGLDDPYWEVRTECALGLSLHGVADASMTASLIAKIYRKPIDRIPGYPIFWPKRIYREKNFEVRAALLRALGSVLDNPELMHALEIPLSEDIWKVREAALDAFVRAARRLRYPGDRIKSLLMGMDLTCTEFIPTFPIRRTFKQLTGSDNTPSVPEDGITYHAL